MAELPVDFWFGTSGRRDAPYLVVGESWSFEEAAEQKPFVGQSGKELRRMLVEAGIAEADCFFTNVVPQRPSSNEMWRFFYPTKEAPVPPLRGLFPMPIILEGLDALTKQIEAVKPKVIIALGNYSLWALTNCSWYSSPSEAEGRRVPAGIMQWRGSMWYADVLPPGLSEIPLVPAIHPAAILRAWYQRTVTVHDFRERARIQAQAGDWRARVAPVVWAPPSFAQAKAKLEEWIARCETGPLRLVNDIETARGLMTCIGFADSEHFAMSIPFIRVRPGEPFESFWPPSEEFTLSKLMRVLLAHPNCHVEGQNYLYDIQYILRYLAVLPNHKFDSMLAHHLLFPGTPKGLDYLSSLYCKYHWYWKEDHKEWDMRGTIEDLLEYNGVDCCRNYEINTVLRGLIPTMGQEAQWREEMEKNELALEMMRRGTRIDVVHRGRLMLELAVASQDFANWFEKVLPQAIVSPDAKRNGKKGITPWFQSPSQQRRFFSEDLGLKLPINRKTEKETFGHEALQTLKERHPEFTRVFEALEDFRSIRVFHNTFVKAPLSADSRMRCMFNTAGTETFRWSSSEDAFGSGTNLQNIPKGEED